MSNKPLIIVSVLLVLISVAFVVHYVQCKYEREIDGMSTPSAMQYVCLITSEYTTAYHRDGEWPAPKTIWDDSMFNYVDSQTTDDGRIDTYVTLSGECYDIYLNNDGTMQCFRNSNCK